jgi:hypothetical protein
VRERRERRLRWEEEGEKKRFCMNHRMHIGVGERKGEMEECWWNNSNPEVGDLSVKKKMFVIGVQHAAPNELRKRVF